MIQSATLEFAAFVGAADPARGMPTVDALDEITAFVRDAESHIAGIEAEILRLPAGPMHPTSFLMRARQLRCARTRGTTSSGG